MEAALLQVYAPRDPLREYLRGQITHRKLRVMVENLPPGNAAARARNPWTDTESLLHDIDGQLRNLQSLTFNIHRGKDTAAQQPEYLPRPKSRAEREAAEREEEQHALERRELLATLARTSQT